PAHAASAGEQEGSGTVAAGTAGQSVRTAADRPAGAVLAECLAVLRVHGARFGHRNLDALAGQLVSRASANPRQPGMAALVDDLRSLPGLHRPDRSQPAA